MDKENFVDFEEFHKKLTTPIVIKPANKSIEDRYKDLKPGGE
ncbi:hypothetical protein [Oceanobacillus damuensis]|nr:hypothetical protein [Oceanobacillus damuensis]